MTNLELLKTLIEEYGDESRYEGYSVGSDSEFESSESLVIKEKIFKILDDLFGGLDELKNILE
jgi:hypothetical protein